MSKQKKITWSPTSIEAIIKHNLAKINLFHGSVRSSKTYTADYIAIKCEISKLPPCNVLISGFSSDSARQNIIAEWEKKLKNEFKEHKNPKGNYYTISTKGLHDKRFFVKGGGKLGDEKTIKGMTLGYWYADEITEYTEEFIAMALSRLSLPYSKAIWTTNPAGPTNTIKKDYIDKEKTGKLKGMFQSFHFNIYDNPSLPISYIKELEQLYHGVFRERNILGKWVAAEGHIYTMLDDLNMTRTVPKHPDKIFIGVDYGTSNMTVFLKVYQFKNIFYVVNEWHHSGQESKDNKTTSEYADHLKDFIGEDAASVTGIFIDPTANAFRTEVKKAGIRGFKKTNNNVLDGIMLLQDLFLKKRILFKYAKTDIALEHLHGYKWDAKEQEKGIDAPLKKGQPDHFCDCLRYIISSVTSLRSINAKSVGNVREAQKILKTY